MTILRTDPGLESIEQDRLGEAVAMAKQPFARSGKQISTPSYDVLAEALRAIRLSGSVFLNARLSEPFGVISPDQFDAGTPLAHLRHVSVFHLIASGSCTSSASGSSGSGS